MAESEVVTPLRARLAAIDAKLSAAPTAKQLSVAVHALIKLVDDMELARIKAFRESITVPAPAVPDVPPVPPLPAEPVPPVTQPVVPVVPPVVNP